MSDTLEIAKKYADLWWTDGCEISFSGLQSFREEIEKLERERCAKVCEEVSYSRRMQGNHIGFNAMHECAEAIRKGDKQ